MFDGRSAQCPSLDRPMNLPRKPCEDKETEENARKMLAQIEDNTALANDARARADAAQPRPILLTSLRRWRTTGSTAR